jgi:hypothetical protein
MLRLTALDLSFFLEKMRVKYWKSHVGIVVMRLKEI